MVLAHFAYAQGDLWNLLDGSSVSSITRSAASGSLHHPTSFAIGNNLFDQSTKSNSQSFSSSSWPLYNSSGSRKRMNHGRKRHNTSFECGAVLGLVDTLTLGMTGICGEGDPSGRMLQAWIIHENEGAVKALYEIQNATTNIEHARTRGFSQMKDLTKDLVGECNKLTSMLPQMVSSGDVQAPTIYDQCRVVQAAMRENVETRSAMPWGCYDADEPVIMKGDLPYGHSLLSASHASNTCREKTQTLKCMGWIQRALGQLRLQKQRLKETCTNISPLTISPAKYEETNPDFGESMESSNA